MDLSNVTNAFESGDFARPNLFKVEIPYLGRNFEFKCRAASMPASTTGEVIVSYQNRKIKLGGDRTFDQWSITVYNDDQHDTRQQFIDWHNQVHGLDNNITGETPETYKKEAVVRQYNRRGQVTRSYTIYGLFPTNVGEIALDWDTNDEIQTFEAQMSYDWWQ
ncbi:MAG: phage tail protein [Acidobacteria bacterium]|nr:phage tail protein [Acidobacteriota bacterium]|tara:strand:+ start:12027 stop:12515 length:489 start_codon:yes stop_codon:yes gene_type:complete